ncbi:endoplasmic reticulum resident protein 44-like isoform X2 [Ruditapes philippinarum]|uniref:endoplasmic reticulum resident protein 44-like isoform X2 n=1 Tax=Ruditapes philippinarum TaxID=129788 RepID=UPI00295AAB96|nr:endoplasmic reticulum resident protein 44-like isoform X2 [Ruditapes philippinarum]
MEKYSKFGILFSRSTCIFIAMTLLLCHGTNGETLQLGGSNFNNIISTHEIVFVNFYADWCRFSQILKPVFEEAGKKVKELFPEQGKVAFGQVDCDSENGIATLYHISKYPTLKLFRNGQAVKKEYRGQRSVDALADFIKNQIEDSIKQHTTMDELDELENTKRNVIGFFDDKETDSYKTFRRVAMQLRDDCMFHAAIGEVSNGERAGLSTKVVFRPPHTRREDVAYTGESNNYDMMLQWMHDKCVPLVREITFENAEELTEEGLPFVILFHKLEDTEVVTAFNRIVQNELLGERTSVNFLTADGTKFSHPLHHLGKSANDLPVLAIDSFRHMYLFKHDVRKDLESPGLVKEFIADLHSGKLHREFHHGPDPVVQQEKQVEQQAGHIPHEPSDKPEQPTSPPESAFQKLAPSDNRYTILRERDEL